MTEFQEFLRHLNLFGAGFLALYALGMKVSHHRKPEHFWQMWLFLALAGIEWGAFASRVDLTYVFPATSLIETPLLFAIGPCFLGWRRGKNPGFLHWVPGILAMMAMVPYFLLPIADKANSLKEFIYAQPDQWSFIWIYTLGGVSIFLYAGWILFAYRDFYRKEILEAERSFVLLLVVCSMAMMICILAGFGVVLGEFFYVHLAAAFIALGAGWVFVDGFRHPMAQAHFQQVLQQPRKNRPPMDDAQSDSLKAELLKLMEDRQIWRDEELSLASLATELDIGIHQLSELLNRGLGLPFAQFVNDYRVAEARRLLVSSEEQVLDIAMACGFNSKASFNRHFSRVTGVSPQQFRQEKRAS